MFRKTSKLLVCAIALLLPLVAGIAVVMAKPAQQTTYPYAFSGAVIDDERGRNVPAMDIQITCGAFSITTTCGQDGEWSAVFNLSTVTVLTFTGIITDTDTPTGHTVLWDFGDGTTTTGTLTPTHTYGDNGVFTVTLTVTDTTGLSATDTLVVTAANVVPAVTIRWANRH